MESGSTSCITTIFSLKNACSTLLNPKYITDNLRVLTGSDQVSDRITVKLWSVYSLLKDDSGLTYQ